MPAATVPEMVHTLDVSALRCPMTWVRTKLELERLESGQTLMVTLPEGEAVENVPRSAREAGHAVEIDHDTLIRITRT
jgi:TusA-related sulfurtransferase